MVEPGFEPRPSGPVSQFIILVLVLFCSTCLLSGLSDEPTVQVNSESHISRHWCSCSKHLQQLEIRGTVRLGFRCETRCRNGFVVCCLKNMLFELLCFSKVCRKIVEEREPPRNLLRYLTLMWLAFRVGSE